MIFLPTSVLFKMSAADESSGDVSSSVDQSEDSVDPIIPTEVQENAVSSEPVYLDSHLPQSVVPGVEIPSRKHEVPSSEIEVETPARPFTIGSEQRHVPLENKTLPLHPNPEEEKGTRESRKIQQLLSPRRSMSEGSTPHNSLKKENTCNSTQQASDDGYRYFSPFVVQELKQRLRQLEERVADVADKKKKFEGLYISEKQKSEEIELRSSKYEREMEKLRNVVYKLDRHAELTTDEESLVRTVHAEQGMMLKVSS